MTGRLTLIIGGQRSGKSRHAEAIVAGSGLAPVYLATATAGDAEMRERIARHRARRGAAWTLIEEPLELPLALAGAASTGTCVLVDCLTLWVSNLVGCGRPVSEAADRLLGRFPSLAGPVVIVSNEVGAGIIPANALARRFIDDLGTLNQQVAAAADAVILMAAGIPIHAKRNGA